MEDVGICFDISAHITHTHAETHINTRVATYTDKPVQIRECLTNPPESTLEEETEISCCVWKLWQHCFTVMPIREQKRTRGKKCTYKGGTKSRNKA